VAHDPEAIREFLGERTLVSDDYDGHIATRLF
jgi:hypothetical protein